MNFYIALLHYPVYNKNGEIIATSIVIHDLHDMSRASKTFGVKTFYVVQPFEQERKIADRIVKFWSTSGREYNPTRIEAISVLKVVENFQQVVDDIRSETSEMPVIIGTSARKKPAKNINYSEVANLLKEEKPVLIIFGTGWGIADEITEKFDCFLPPIVGITDFNHLSVRSACSITLDRIIEEYKKLF